MLRQRQVTREFTTGILISELKNLTLREESHLERDINVLQLNPVPLATIPAKTGNMPYKRKGKCVYRKDTGKKVGCSKTTSKAKKYVKALYANVEDSESFNELVESVIRIYVKV